ncbi:hypothetical protein FRC07_009348, partial [Ceratobasidium sp. 392]
MKTESSYLLYDIIDDLALGTPFGMVSAQKDAAPIAQSFATDQAEAPNTVDLPVINILDVSERSFVTLAPYPGWIQDLLRVMPWNTKNMKAQQSLFGMAVAAANKRIRVGSQAGNEGDGENLSEKASTDMIGKLMEIQDENGLPLSNEVIVGEASLMLVAGTDTTSNFEHAKKLPYLGACIHESFRLHPPIGQGLPRIIPPGNFVVIAGEVFKPGSVVSVPIYTTNRSSIFGPDVDKFRPERWLKEGFGTMSQYNVPFSLGSR